MHHLVLYPEIEERLRIADNHSPSVGDKLNELQSNPLTNAIKTNNPNLGEYYVNAGKWCLIFNIDGDSVEILSVMHSAKLYKILTGRITI